MSLSLGCVWSYQTAAPGMVIQTLWMEPQTFVSWCVLPSSFPYQPFALHLCLYSSNCSKPGLKIPLDCLAKQSTVFPGEHKHCLCNGDLRIRQELHLPYFYPEFRFHTDIAPILTHAWQLLTLQSVWQKQCSCCTIFTSDSGKRAKASYEPSNSFARVTLENSLEMPFPLSTLRAGFNCSPFVANGGRGGDIKPFLAAPFSQGSMHSIRGF